MIKLNGEHRIFRRQKTAGHTGVQMQFFTTRGIDTQMYKAGPAQHPRRDDLDDTAGVNAFVDGTEPQSLRPDQDINDSPFLQLAGWEVAKRRCNLAALNRPRQAIHLTKKFGDKRVDGVTV